VKDGTINYTSGTPPHRNIGEIIEVTILCQPEVEITRINHYDYTIIIINNNNMALARV